jgi:hypothetical protein
MLCGYNSNIPLEENIGFVNKHGVYSKTKIYRIRSKNNSIGVNENNISSLQ